MEDTVFQRVTDILNVRYDGNVSRMSKALAINTTTLAYQLNGKRSISLDTITAIAKAKPPPQIRAKTTLKTDPPKQQKRWVFSWSKCTFLGGQKFRCFAEKFRCFAEEFRCFAESPFYN